MNFLPTTISEAKRRGWDELDVIIVSADAYVDHPAFAAAIIGRFLESPGLRVGIIPQPDWRGTADFKALGRPRLFFGVTAGNLDSMVALYTSQRKIRSDDPYSEGGTAGMKPYLPSIVYTNRLKEIYKGVPVVLGGIEASLRRIAHFDFYTGKVRPSLLIDSKADMLVYGNGEAPLKEIVARFKRGQKIPNMTDIPGTAIPVGKSSRKTILSGREAVIIPAYEDAVGDKDKFLLMTRIIADNLNPFSARPLFQSTGNRGVLVNPPAKPLSAKELDGIYELPFCRKAHPRYKAKIPALSIVETSIVSHRGCYGGCSFCALALHQGRFIQSRSTKSIEKEAMNIADNSRDGEVTITNVGGPTANMYGTGCRDKQLQGSCRRTSCLYPNICKNLDTSHGEFRKVLGQLRKNKKIKHVFVNSGIRYDLALMDRAFIDELARHYTPGQLSAAPEHSVEELLCLMGKPDIRKFEEFAAAFNGAGKKAGKKQYIIPYFIIGFPGASEATERALAEYIRRNRITVEQIQEFYPTPMSIATAIYYTGKDPFTGKSVKVEKRLGIIKRWKKMIV